MTNYKPHHQNITFGGIETEIPFGAQLKSLVGPSNATTTGNTFHDTQDNSNYIVPTGKRFYPIGVTISHFSLAGFLITIFYADDVDGTSNEKSLVTFMLRAGNAQQIIDIPLPELNSSNKYAIADKYVNYKTGVAANTSTPVKLIGYEIDD